MVGVGTGLLLNFIGPWPLAVALANIAIQADCLLDLYVGVGPT